MKLKLCFLAVLFAFPTPLFLSMALADENANPQKHAAPAENDEQTSDGVANLQINPLGLIFGELDMNLDFGVTSSITVGPTFSALNASVDDGQGDVVSIKSISYGVRSNFCLSGTRFRDSWYLSPAFYYMPATVNQTVSGDSFSATLHIFELRALVGYQWVWNSGFNIKLGGGIAYYSVGNSVVVTNSAGTSQTAQVPTFSGLMPALEFGLGWVF